MDHSGKDIKPTLLYQNAARTVTLLDLPWSIALAQRHGAAADAPQRVLVSCEPRRMPYTSTEPKSEKAVRNLRERMGSPPPFAVDHQKLIWNGLRELQEKHIGDSLLPRQVDDAAAAKARKGKAESLQKGQCDEGPIERSIDLAFTPSGRTKAAWILATSSVQNSASNASAIAQRLMMNPNVSTSTLQVDSLGTTFYIPGDSSFFLDTIDPLSAERWSAAVSHHLATPTSTAGPGQFDLVILDPPWPNRSARRAGSYATARSRSPFEAVAGVLGRHLAPNALVACWVTNGSEPRAAALRALDDWGVRLTEEWVWVKITTHGEPVTAVDGLWRKPYEVLLVGREEQGVDGVGNEKACQNEASVARRLIAAVPDLHSRKPCLRVLLEQLMGRAEGYRALEVFARYLSHGWSAWGDEVIKFNAAGCWIDEGTMADSKDMPPGPQKV